MNQFAVPEWTSWDRGHECSWYFIENDSADGTRAALEAFVRAPGRRARLLSGRLARTFRGNRLSTNAGRIFAIAEARNALLDAAAADIAAAEWVFVLDADIYYTPMALLNLAITAPADAAAVVPYTEQVERPGTSGAEPIPRAARVPHAPGAAACTLRHYYDTFSSFDAAGSTYYPWCAWACGRGCGARTGRSAAPGAGPVVRVRSGFGGAAAVRPGPLASGAVRWGSLCLEGASTGATSICEHVLFFDRLRAVALVTGQPSEVYVQPGVRAWRTK